MSDAIGNDPLKQECWEKRFSSFGTAKIFEDRIHSLGKKRRLITFLGLATPLTVGAFVGAYSADSPTLKLFVIPIVGAVTIIQALLSLWSIVAQWDTQYAYAVASVKSNNRLASDFEELAKATPEKRAKGMERLRFEYSRQDSEDISQEITDKEKRFGQRSALFQYQSKCPSCGFVPKNMTSTDCDSCGNY